MTKAFYDVRCEKCRRKFGWHGKWSDRPACPHCGHTIPREELLKQEKKTEAMLKQVVEEISHEWNEKWARRTPALEEAYRLGAAARKEFGDLPPLDRMKKMPRNIAGGWWNWGFNEAGERLNASASAGEAGGGQ